MLKAATISGEPIQKGSLSCTTRKPEGIGTKTIGDDQDNSHRAETNPI